MVNLQRKLYNLKQHLKWWNKQVFVNIFYHVKETESLLASQKETFDNNPTDSNLVKLKILQANLT